MVKIFFGRLLFATLHKYKLKSTVYPPSRKFNFNGISKQRFLATFILKVIFWHMFFTQIKHNILHAFYILSVHIIFALLEKLWEHVRFHYLFGEKKKHLLYILLGRTKYLRKKKNIFLYMEYRKKRIIFLVYTQGLTDKRCEIMWWCVKYA